MQVNINYIIHSIYLFEVETMNIEIYTKTKMMKLINLKLSNLHQTA